MCLHKKLETVEKTLTIPKTKGLTCKRGVPKGRCTPTHGCMCGSLNVAIQENMQDRRIGYEELPRENRSLSPSGSEVHTCRGG
jgi:hypothetical protein